MAGMTDGFERMYASVPPHQRETLFSFRDAGHRRSIEAGGRSWGYVALGDGGHTIVFLPGGFAPADMWLLPMLALQARYRVISVDCSLETFDAEACVEALLEILEREGVDRFSLVGSSYGGGLAQHVLQVVHDRVVDAVLSHCTAIGDRLVGQMRRMRSVVRFMPRAAIDLQWGVAQRRAGPEGLEWSAYAAAYLREVGARVDKPLLLRFLDESSRSSARFRFDSAALERWPGRVLLMSSRDDESTFPHLGDLRSRYPGAREHVFAHGGHATLLFRPDAYTEVLSHFLDEGIV